MAMATPIHAETARLPIEPLMADDALVVWQHRGSSGRLVLAFSGIGKRVEAVPPYEFARIATGDGADSTLFIIDPQRTWLNGEGLIERIVAVVEEFAESVGVDDYLTLGHSMGGYAAMVISDFLPVKSAVALSPQYSVHPDVAGDDPRWMFFRRRIPEHRLTSIAEHIVEGTQYHVFHGGNRVERPQRNRFPVLDNLMHTILPNTAHAVPQKLKRLGLLHAVVRAALDNQPKLVRRTLTPLGAHRRKLKQYPALAPYAEVVT